MKNKQFIINVINDQSNNYINEMNSSLPLLPPPSNEASNENQENCPPLPNPGFRAPASNTELAIVVAKQKPQRIPCIPVGDTILQPARPHNLAYCARLTATNIAVSGSMLVMQCLRLGHRNLPALCTDPGWQAHAVPHQAEHTKTEDACIVKQAPKSTSCTKH